MSRSWANNGGLALSAANLNAMEADIGNARTNAVTDANTYTDGQVATDRARLTAAEAKQAVKCVRLESGAWVWDNTSAATHYLIPDFDGSLIVRTTAQPVPASTPVLNW